MAYAILDNRNNTDLERGLFATLSAIRGVQFGREVYSSLIKFKDLADFLEIFPEVQRDILPRKVASIKRYIMSANNENLRFFSSITVSCKGYVLYDETNKRLALDVANTKLSINDGQHRFEAVRIALSQLENDFQKSKDKEKTKNIREKIDKLEEMVLPIVIFNGLKEYEEKQLFHDLNNLQQRPSRNANIKLNQTDYFAKLARDVADNSPYLIALGVEKEKSSIHLSNPNTILLTTIYNSMKLLFKSKEEYINDENYDAFLQEGLEWIGDLFQVLPPDINIKGKYLLDRSYSITAIFRFINSELTKGKTKVKILKAIQRTDFRITNKVWKEYGARVSKQGKIEFTGGTNGGYRTIYNVLTKNIQKIR